MCATEGIQFMTDFFMKQPQTVHEEAAPATSGDESDSPAENSAQTSPVSPIMGACLAEN